MEQAGDRLHIIVTDDGVGGADPARGTGLAGLARRAESVDGTLDDHQPAGRADPALRGPAMRAVTARRPARWVWAVSGLAAAAALAIPGTYLITMADVPRDQARPVAITTRTVTVPQPVTSLSVRSYGGQVRVTAGTVSHVQVTERIVYDPPAGLPAVAESVSGGRLSLGDAAAPGRTASSTSP